MNLSGIFPPVPSIFREDGALDLTRFQENIRRLCETGIAGVVILGSNGEYVYLTENEKREVIRAGIEAVPEGKLALVGTGSESTRATIVLSEEAARLGADAVMVVSPHYYKPLMTLAVLEKFYNDVAEASAVPVILYSVPRFTGIELGAGLVSSLARHPNIVGIKDSSGNVVQISEFVSRCPSDFQVLVGSGSALYPALAVGAVGGVLALAIVAPRECVQVQRLFTEGRHDEARQLQMRLLPVNQAVTGTYGIPGVKAAMDLLGYHGGAPRAPLQALGEQERDRIRGILEQAGLLPYR